MIDLNLCDFSIIRELNDNSGMRKVLILHRKDGHYCFAEMQFWPPAPEDEGHDIGWAGEFLSGVYGTREEAEKDARRLTLWLRDQPSS
jgi:hypothetical protein